MLEFAIMPDATIRLFGQRSDLLAFLASNLPEAEITKRKIFRSGQAVWLKLTPVQVQALTLNLNLTIPNWGKARLLTEQAIAGLTDKNGEMLQPHTWAVRVRSLAAKIDADWQPLQGQHCTLPATVRVYHQPVTRADATRSRMIANLQATQIQARTAEGTSIYA